MPHLQVALVVTHIIAFATGYYLALKNTRPKQKFSTHGVKQERISPRPDSEAYEDQ